MKVRDVVITIDGQCDGSTEPLTFEVRGWHDGETIVHYMKDFSKEGADVPDMIMDMLVQNIYAKSANYFVIDVVMA